MAGEFKPNNLQETRLFKRLLKPYPHTGSAELAKALIQILPEICKIANDRMKLMPKLHPEFTLHDDIHLLRVAS